MLTLSSSASIVSSDDSSSDAADLAAPWPGWSKRSVSGPSTASRRVLSDDDEQADKDSKNTQSYCTTDSQTSNAQPWLSHGKYRKREESHHQYFAPRPQTTFTIDDDDDDDHHAPASTSHKPTSKVLPYPESAIISTSLIWQENPAENMASLPMPTYGRISDKFTPYSIALSLYHKLYPHQRQGISWMWCMHFASTRGAILGDDMGLGKTIQVIAFLSGLFKEKTISSALIVMPLGCLGVWKEEFRRWCPHIPVLVYHGTSAKPQDLRRIQRTGGVVLTTYGLIPNNTTVLNYAHVWDYMVLDEGHVIKNPRADKAKSVREIHSVHRLILTGTPVQNNLKEMWSLFDFSCHGTLFGDEKAFQERWGKPINRASAKDASLADKREAELLAAEIRSMIAPYFLRREKASILSDQNQPSPARDGTMAKESVRQKHSLTLGSKIELVIWVSLSDNQVNIYRSFLKDPYVQEYLNTTKSPLAAIGILGKICSHPFLLRKKDGEGDEVEEAGLTLNITPPSTYIESTEMSSKLIVLLQLLVQLKNDGHRTLVFSQSRKILDIIAHWIEKNGLSHQRIDGAVTDRSERQIIIEDFNAGRGDLMLLTTKIGVGITLTGADRVILFDPCWNPSLDSQAVDRAYRVGQKKDVVVYRFVTVGTVEDKIYRNQVRKMGLSRSAIVKGGNMRYFKHAELKSMFNLEEDDTARTLDYLNRMHPISDAARQQSSLDHLSAIPHVSGASCHDLLYSFEDSTDLVTFEADLSARSKLGIIARPAGGSSQGWGQDYLGPRHFNPKLQSNDHRQDMGLKSDNEEALMWDLSDSENMVPVESDHDAAMASAITFSLESDQYDRTQNDKDDVIFMGGDIPTAWKPNEAFVILDSDDEMMHDAPISNHTSSTPHVKHDSRDMPSDMMNDGLLPVVPDMPSSPFLDVNPTSTCPTLTHRSKFFNIRKCRCHLPDEGALIQYMGHRALFGQNMASKRTQNALIHAEKALQLCDDDDLLKYWTFHLLAQQNEWV